jgi:hypothetical protein
MIARLRVRSQGKDDIHCRPSLRGFAESYGQFLGANVGHQDSAVRGRWVDGDVTFEEIIAKKERVVPA